MDDEGTWMIKPRSVRMRRIVDRARHLTHETQPLVIEGERGSGKSTLARAIHEWSTSGREGIFVTLPCTDMSSAKLAWAMRHATTGLGCGTIVLDEIERLPAPLMTELAAVICQHSHTFMGVALHVERPPVRMIALSRAPIERALNAGGAEAARLQNAAVILRVPPLRERREDVLPLAQHFLELYAQQDHKEGLAFTAQARYALATYAWPGNVRELSSVVERSVVVARGPEVDVADLALPRSANEPALWPEGYPSLDALERTYILRVIRESPTLEDAARILKVDITTLWRKRRRYGI